MAYVQYTVHSREPGAGSDLELFVPFAAGLAADAHRDSAPPSAAQLLHAPRVDHDEGPIPRLSAYRRAIWWCAPRSCARVYVASRHRGAPETMAAGVFCGAQLDADSVRHWLSRGSGRRGCSLGGMVPAGNTILPARNGIPVSSNHHIPLV